MDQYRWSLTLGLLGALVSREVVAREGGDHRSPYKGQERRQIKSLSPKDIDALRNGRGWGFAKAAELNGVPGPAHVLELAEKLALTQKQRSDVSSIFLHMRRRATKLGLLLIRKEKALEDYFRSGETNQRQLRDLLIEAGAVRAELRFTHLRAHLQTGPILTAKQIGTYRALRGYQSEPCASAMPTGHDPTMWRLHNGCE